MPHSTFSQIPAFTSEASFNLAIGGEHSATASNNIEITVTGNTKPSDWMVDFAHPAQQSEEQGRNNDCFANCVDCSTAHTGPRQGQSPLRSKSKSMARIATLTIQR